MKQKLLTTLAGWLLLIAFMSGTDPNKLPVFFLIVPFVLLFFVLMQTWGLFHYLHRRFIAKQTPQASSRRLAATVCVSIVLLVVLQSLGQLTLRDVITIVAIAIIGYIYTARNYFHVTKR